jgi:siroheme synthase (precorrin-2 oxidase/ferrochelatase)
MADTYTTALVIGYGSIGARHARLLIELGCRTIVVSGRSIDFPIVYPSIETAFLNSKSHK